MDIIPEYQHSKIGTFLFNLCAKTTKFLVKYKFLYYFLALTWGLMNAIIGFLVFVALNVAHWFTPKVKISKYHWMVCISAGPNYWGGFSCGLTFVRDQKSHISINKHEFGHSFQGMLFGPLFIFIIAIPSVIRYWTQTIREKQGKENKPYDSRWFEDAASQCGRYVVNYLENK